MALKGKKKSRARGSQARRRPAGAPRPSYGGREKPPWYQTTPGLVIAFVIAVAVIAFLWWLIADARSESRALETRQDELQSYTTDLRELTESLTPVTSELVAAGDLEDPELARKVRAWKNQLAEIQTTVAQSTPPTGLEALGPLVSQSLLLYVQSVEQYELLPSLEGKARDQVAAKAAASFQAADNVFASVIQILDSERQDAELSTSGLTSPGQAALPEAPPGAELPGTEGGTDTIEIPAGDEGDEGDE